MAAAAQRLGPNPAYIMQLFQVNHQRLGGLMAQTTMATSAASMINSSNIRPPRRPGPGGCCHLNGNETTVSCSIMPAVSRCRCSFSHGHAAECRRRAAGDISCAPSDIRRSRTAPFYTSPESLR